MIFWDQQPQQNTKHQKKEELKKNKIIDTGVLEMI